MLERRWFRFRGIMAWITISGAIIVGASILTITLLESRIIERAGEHNRQAAFLLLSQSVSKMINKAGGTRETAVLEELIHNIREIRPGILRISIFEVTPQSGSLIVSSDPSSVPKALDPWERAEIEAGRSVVQLDDSLGERAWRITAPITIEGKVVGALRGLFSVKEYDELIKQEIDVAKAIGVSVIVVASSIFWVLIQVKVHRPIHQLLSTMRSVETGDLRGQAPVTGPTEIQELAIQFNRMLERVRATGIEKDQLLGEIRHFNETLQKRVVEATAELQQTNLELVEARLVVERSQRLAALGELSATVAHELGNPLNALSGHLQMLTYTDDPANQQRHLAVIRSEVDRMVAIIKQLLDQTHVPQRSTLVDLNTTIRKVLALLSPGLSRQQITLKLDLQEGLPPVAGDVRALHGLLFNLITNAKQAMPLGGELTVRTRVAGGVKLPGVVRKLNGGEPDGTVVRLTITDTGKGIPPEHLSKIFEPFFTTRRDEGGTGLGLAICHRVVTDSGGRLAVKSDVGYGTEFTVDLPIWKAEPEVRREP